MCLCSVGMCMGHKKLNVNVSSVVDLSKKEDKTQFSSLHFFLELRKKFEKKSVFLPFETPQKKSCCLAGC